MRVHPSYIMTRVVPTNYRSGRPRAHMYVIMHSAKGPLTTTRDFCQNILASRLVSNVFVLRSCGCKKIIKPTDDSNTSLRRSIVVFFPHVEILYETHTLDWALKGFSKRLSILKF